MAFSMAGRDRLGLHGLLPPSVVSLQQQMTDSLPVQFLPCLPLNWQPSLVSCSGSLFLIAKEKHVHEFAMVGGTSIGQDRGQWLRQRAGGGLSTIYRWGETQAYPFLTVLSSLVIAFTDVEVDEDLLGPALILWKLMHADSRLHAPTAAACSHVVHAGWSKRQSSSSSWRWAFSDFRLWVISLWRQD